MLLAIIGWRSAASLPHSRALEFLIACWLAGCETFRWVLPRLDARRFRQDVREFIGEFISANNRLSTAAQRAIAVAPANDARCVSGMRRMNTSEITAVAMIRNAGAS